MDRMGHSRMRAALIYLQAAGGASKTIAAGIDRHLAAAQEKEASGPMMPTHLARSWHARRSGREAAPGGDGRRRCPAPLTRPAAPQSG
jgi:hypothetical protein